MSASPGAGRAAIVAVGSELLALGRTDTNSPFIAQALTAAGLQVVSTTVVGDERDDLRRTITAALAAADLVVCTGGLGPTDDDRTRDVAADVAGLPLSLDQSVLEAIRARFVQRGLAMPAINERQAMVPSGGTIVPNTRGTAPGLWIPAGPRAMLLLPGPPREMRPMLAEAIATHVAPRWGGRELQQRMIVLAGRSESSVDELAAPIYRRWLDEAEPVVTTILASLASVELHLSARGHDRAATSRRLEAAVGALVDVFGPDVVSTDGRRLEQVIGDLLVARGWRLAVAESCTGGLVTSRLTRHAGASAWLDRAFVTYSNAAKTELLEVPKALLAEHGAVSAQVAAAMAEGARRRAGVDVALAVTGIAGPGGGTEDKPVGLVYIAVSSPSGTTTKTLRLLGDRTFIREISATHVLDLLRRTIAAGGGV